MIKTKIVGTKNGHELSVNPDGSTNTYIIPAPPIGIEQQTLPFSEYLKLNGTGTNSFLIDGSIVTQDFFISARDYDVYINTIIFEIADATATMNKFGNLTALTNGLEFFYFNKLQGKYIIESGLKTNYDMVKLANFEPPFGSSPLTNAVSTSEAYVGVIDLEDVFGLQWGLRLKANSLDKIGFTVKDNITGIDVMTIKAYGIRV
jgi:hypothetical protein